MLRSLQLVEVVTFSGNEMMMNECCKKMSVSVDEMIRGSVRALSRRSPLRVLENLVALRRAVLERESWSRAELCWNKLERWAVP